MDSTGLRPTLQCTREEFHAPTHLARAAVVLLSVNGKSYAQESDIKTAINAYHAGTESLDMSKMERLWAHDATVILINPNDKSISVGWDAVKKEWEAAFVSLAELKDTQADGPYVQVKGDVAWAW
jgi:ketosteroid isomerase-like protein